MYAIADTAELKFAWPGDRNIFVMLTYILCLQQDIEEFSFVTQLAGLTDHISVAARLAVSTGEEEP